MSQNWRKSVFIVKSCPETNHHISEDWEQRKDLHTSKKCVCGGGEKEVQNSKWYVITMEVQIQNSEWKLLST